VRAADDAAFDEPIPQSMAEAFAAAGGLGTPAMVLHQDPPVGFLDPVVAAPPTGADAPEFRRPREAKSESGEPAHRLAQT
jgi:hypothetical protein